MVLPTIPVFELGSLYSTATVMDLAIEQPVFQTFIRSCVRRHLACDWGDCCPDDRALNDQALTSDGRLFSVYKLADRFTPLADALWIITESDRSHTTILFPSEY